MHRHRLREATMPGLRNNSSNALYKRCESSRRGWWEHLMLSNSISHSSVPLIQVCTKHPNPKHHTTRVIWRRTMALNEDRRAWREDRWLMREISESWGTSIMQESTSWAKRHMECSTWTTWTVWTCRTWAVMVAVLTRSCNPISSRNNQEWLEALIEIKRSSRTRTTGLCQMLAGLKLSLWIFSSLWTLRTNINSNSTWVRTREAFRCRKWV